jgi:lipopolysaccharide export system permease protein
MRLLDRYLLRELLVPLGYCAGGFIVFWVAFDLFEQLDRFQANRMTTGDVVEYYAVRLPEFVVTALPLALLLALLYALSRHARYHEITAIRAAGVSVWRLAAPYFGVGLLAGAVLFSLNEWFVPDATEQAELIKHRRVSDARTVARDVARQIGFTNERERRAWQIAEFNFRTAEMLKPKVFEFLPDGSQRWLDAERGGRVHGVWTFFNVRLYRVAAGTNAVPTLLLQTNALARPDFTETPEQIRSELKIARRLSGRVERAADVPLRELLDYLRFHPHPARGDRPWLYTKLHARLAMPWTCLIVVLVALPVGLASGRRNLFVGVAGSIVICFGYFVLGQLGIALGTGGHLPPWLAGWLANVVFGLGGLWWTARVR